MTKLIYVVVDPMCSWCWGFAPEVARLRAAAKGRANVRVIAGGLRPGTIETMDRAMKEYISHHWQQVHEKTGQPFDFSLFERDGFVYDTEPGCRAVITARTMAGDDAGLDMAEALHEAFYARATDITRADALADAAEKIGLDRAAFAEKLASPEMRDASVRDFQIARALGVSGFPTVVCEDRETGADGKSESQFAFLAMGYRPFDSFRPLLEEWLAAGTAAEEEAEGAFCRPGETC